MKPCLTVGSGRAVDHHAEKIPAENTFGSLNLVSIFPIVAIYRITITVFTLFSI
jgi:hypothetical protein